MLALCCSCGFKRFQAVFSRPVPATCDCVSKLHHRRPCMGGHARAMRMRSQVSIPLWFTYVLLGTTPRGALHVLGPGARVPKRPGFYGCPHFCLGLGRGEWGSLGRGRNRSVGSPSAVLVHHPWASRAPPHGASRCISDISKCTYIAIGPFGFSRARQTDRQSIALPR